MDLYTQINKTKLETSSALPNLLRGTFLLIISSTLCGFSFLIKSQVPFSINIFPGLIIFTLTLGDKFLDSDFEKATNDDLATE